MEHLLVAATPDARVARLAAVQHGVVDYAQLRQAGLTPGAINHRVGCGRLHRLHRRVFAVGHTRLSSEGRSLAAVLSLGRGAVLTHVSAGAHLALRPSAAGSIHVTVPTPGGRLRRPGIVVHRSTTLRPADVIVRDAIPVTSVSRTLLDLAGMLAPGPLERAVERSLELRVFDLTAIRSVIDANPNSRGASRLARIVAGMRDEPPLTRSELEARMRDLCDAIAIARPEVNARVGAFEVDFLWRPARLIAETDGREHHGTPAAFERDRARDARLMVLGYRVVRFTHRQLRHERDVVATTLKALTDAVRLPAAPR